MKRLSTIVLFVIGCTQAADDRAAGKVQEGRARVAPVGHTLRLPARPEPHDGLVRGLAACPLEGYQIVSTCPGLVAFQAATRNATPDANAQLGRRMIGNGSPAVRIAAAELMNGPGGPTRESQDAIADAAAREPDGGVTEAFIRIAGDHGAHNPNVAAMLLAAVAHPDGDVRLQAIHALSAPANRGLPGGALALVALAESDREARVRHAACEYGGRLGNTAFLPFYERATASAADHEMYAACMAGLVAMFHNHPALDTADEEAYRLFLRRLDARPRSEHAPPWNVTSAFCYFSHESDLTRVAAWRQRATWFDPAEVERVMTSIVGDKAASWQARVGAIESLVGLGATRAELAALRRGLHAGDASDKAVLDKLASALGAN